MTISDGLPGPMKLSRILCGVILFTVSQANAALIYDSGGPNNAQWRNSDLNSQGVAADDFSLSSESTVSSIGWFGSYLFFPSQPQPDSFTVQIYEDQGNDPANAPLHTAIFTSALSRTFTGVSVATNYGTFDMYEYSVDIQPLTFNANTRYWLSIFNETPETTVNQSLSGWAWAYSTVASTHRWKKHGEDWTTFGSSDLAFSLNGDDANVPEPGVLFLLTAGMFGLGFYRWKGAF